jgi:hypothetical protein
VVLVKVLPPVIEINTMNANRLIMGVVMMIVKTLMTAIQFSNSASTDSTFTQNEQDKGSSSNIVAVEE